MSKIKCSDCGNEVNANSKFCPECGEELSTTEKVENVEVVETVAKENKENTSKVEDNMVEKGYNILSIIGFVLAFIPKLTIVAFIISIIALIQINKTNEKGKGLAIAGIAISSIIFFLGIIVFLIAMITGLFYRIF